jgi:hypothetical protein
MPFFIPLICLMAIGMALYRRSFQAARGDPGAPDDLPAQLLRWATGLLSARREEWGRAMLGELGHVDGRARRWRFALGCAGAALLLPPWGRAAAVAWATGAIAAGAVGLYAFVGARYGLQAGDWAYAAVALVLLAGYAVAASVLARQPGIALPGLLGGLLLAVVWLAPGQFTFYGFIAAVQPFWAAMGTLVVVPLLAGAIGTLHGGSAAAGRRIARLAAFTAGLYVFLYGTLAVAVLGLGGPPGDPGCTGSCNIGDRLGNNTIFYLWLLPLTTAAIGWAAATATARIRPRPPVGIAAAAFAASSGLGEGSRDPVAALDTALPEAAAAEMTGPEEAFEQKSGRTGRARHWRRTAYLPLACAVVVVALSLLALGMLAR